MNVLHFCKSFSLLSETFIYDYVTELERQGENNHVVTFRRVNEDSRPFPKVTVVDRPSRWHPRRLWNRALVPMGHREKGTSFWPQIHDRLESAVREVDPNVIHAHFGPAGVIIAPVADALDIPLVITLYGYDVSRLARDEFWRHHYPPTFQKASLLLGISGHICSRIESLGGDPGKIEKWHLGIDLSQFEYQPADQSFDGSTVCCLHVGRLVEKKSPVHLIRAFKFAQNDLEQGYDLKLKIAGDGPLRGEAEREIRELDLEDSVYLLGAVPHEEVSSLLREANIYTQHCKTASDGDQEGQGVSFVEASASGLPIVSTRHNGLPDVILDEETGFLVEEGNSEEMGQKIAHLASNPERWNEIGRKGRMHMEERFDLSKQIEKMKEIYSGIKFR